MTAWEDRCGLVVGEGTGPIAPDTKNPRDEPGEGDSSVDVHIGRRIRLRRLLMGVSQSRLAVALNVTQQQIQLVERGSSRLSASRLYEIARALDADIEFFYEGLLQGARPRSGGGSELVAAGLQATELNADGRTQREAAALVRAYSRITDPEQRGKAMDIIRSLSSKGKP